MMAAVGHYGSISLVTNVVTHSLPVVSVRFGVLPMPENTEFDAATAAAHNELAAAYASNAIDVPQPIDENLWRMAYAIARVVVRTYEHRVGTEGFYEMTVPTKYASIRTPVNVDSMVWEMLGD
jgi:hypothetical protein